MNFLPLKRGGVGGLLEDLWYTCIHILKDVNKRGTFFVKNGMKKKLKRGGASLITFC